MEKGVDKGVRNYHTFDRQAWIDALKGYGILCVTLAHLNPNKLLETHIYSYHMFLFFFISGYLYRPQSLKGYLRKKTTTILVPFVLWDLLASIVELAINHKALDVVDRFFILHGNVCWNAPIWFLLILYLTEVIYATINDCCRKAYIPYVAFAGNVIIWFIIGSHKFPLMLNLLPLALFSFAYGDIFKKTLLRKNDLIKRTTLIKTLLCVSGLLSVLFGMFLNCRISYTGAKFGNFYYCLIAAISGCTFFILLFIQYKQLAQNKLLCLIGRNSMIIMATQYWVFRLFDALSMNMLGLSVWHGRSTIKAIGCCGITISIIILGVSIVKKCKNKNIISIAALFGIR